MDSINNFIAMLEQRVANYVTQSDATLAQHNMGVGRYYEAKDILELLKKTVHDAASLVEDGLELKKIL